MLNQIRNLLECSGGYYTYNFKDHYSFTGSFGLTIKMLALASGFTEREIDLKNLKERERKSKLE